MGANVEEIVRRVDLWKGEKVSYEILSGGITNHNYTVHANGKKYVLRIPGEGTEIFIDRSHERSATRASARAGVAPDVLSVVMPEACIVIPFVEGEVLHPGTVFSDREKIVKIVQAVKQVHDNASFEPDTNVFDMVRKYIRMASEVNAFFPEDFDWMRRIADQIEQAMERDKPKPVACHNDLLPENFIIDPGGKLWIIDWEYGGMGDPFFDLGDFAVEHPFSMSHENLIIETYCGELQPHRLYRMLLYKMMADLWWSIWAMIQNRVSKISFDFFTYGLGRYARFRSGYYHRGFKTWLAGV